MFVIPSVSLSIPDQATFQSILLDCLRVPELDYLRTLVPAAYDRQDVLTSTLYADLSLFDPADDAYFLITVMDANGIDIQCSHQNYQWDDHFLSYDAFPSELKVQ